MRFLTRRRTAPLSREARTLLQAYADETLEALRNTGRIQGPLPEDVREALGEPSPLEHAIERGASALMSTIPEYDLPAFSGSFLERTGTDERIRLAGLHELVRHGYVYVSENGVRLTHRGILAYGTDELPMRTRP
jgi:hypothetical protein